MTWGITHALWIVGTVLTSAVIGGWIGAAIHVWRVRRADRNRYNEPRL